VPPVRTCVACRVDGPPDGLIRLVAHPDTGEIVVDVPGRLPGRGAWVHPARACVEKVERQGGRLGHALRATVSTDGLGAQIRARVHDAVLDGLSLAAASGSLIGGHDRLREALEKREIAIVAVAVGASPRTLASLREVAGEVPFVPIDLGADALGERLGRGSRAAVGILRTRGAAHALRWLPVLAALG
jgi:predicted RNA-binding protein YlxR (DUF448 family)